MQRRCWLGCSGGHFVDPWLGCFGPVIMRVRLFPAVGRASALRLDDPAQVADGITHFCGNGLHGVFAVSE